MASRPGRPRAGGPSTSGRGTDEDILEAAAVLFCEVGYSSTSTYAIAERAGVRQASLYHHFAGKHEILRALLLSTVSPSLELAERLAASAEPPPVRLWALCAGDVRLLGGGRANLGALYLFPEVDDERFADFRDLHRQLRDRYTGLVAECSPAVDPAEAAETGHLVLSLVEGVILRRREDPGLDVDALAERVADGALALLGLPRGAAAAARVAGEALLDGAGAAPGA